MLGPASVGLIVESVATKNLSFWPGQSTQLVGGSLGNFQLLSPGNNRLVKTDFAFVVFFDIFQWGFVEKRSKALETLCLPSNLPVFDVGQKSGAVSSLQRLGLAGVFTQTWVVRVDLTEAVLEENILIFHQAMRTGWVTSRNRYLTFNLSPHWLSLDHYYAVKLSSNIFYIKYQFSYFWFFNILTYVDIPGVEAVLAVVRVVPVTQKLCWTGSVVDQRSGHHDLGRMAVTAWWKHGTWEFIIDF